MFLIRSRGIFTGTRTLVFLSKTTMAKLLNKNLSKNNPWWMEPLTPKDVVPDLKKK